MRNIELTESDIALELVTGLGGKLDINGVEIHPVSIGVISLLACIDSPFVSTNEKAKPNTKDLIDALYICHLGYEAVTGIYQAQRKINKLEKMQFATVANSDNYKYLVERVEYSTEAFKEFDQAVFDFADKLGLFDVQMASEWLVEQLNIGINGYKMIQGKESQYDDKVKKKRLTSSILPGYQKQLPWWLRILIRVIRKYYGKCHLCK